MKFKEYFLKELAMPFEKSTLIKGAKIEKEHTKNFKKAKKIATDHIKEFPKINTQGTKQKNDDTIDSEYYIELDKVERKLKNNSIDENSMAGGSGSVFGPNATGSHGGQVGNTDWYAQGDSRVPTILGAKSKKKKKKFPKIIRRSMY